jgi:hypothetical protein
MVNPDIYWYYIESYNELERWVNQDNVCFILLFTHTDALRHEYF